MPLFFLQGYSIAICWPCRPAVTVYMVNIMNIICYISQALLVMAEYTYSVNNGYQWLTSKISSDLGNGYLFGIFGISVGVEFSSYQITSKDQLNIYSNQLIIIIQLAMLWYNLQLPNLQYKASCCQLLNTSLTLQVASNCNHTLWNTLSLCLLNGWKPFQCKPKLF